MIAIGAAGATARADVSDAVWAALKEREVAIETPQGEVRGKLAGIDAKNVVLLKSDGTPITVSRATVKNVRAVVQESAPAPAPVPSAAPAPTETAAPAPPLEDQAPPPHPEIAKMMNTTVIVWLANGDRVLGKLTDADPQNIAIRTGTGLRVVRRVDIDNIARWAPMPSSSSMDSGSSGGDSGMGSSENTGEPAGREARNTRGLWLSADLSILALNYQWNDYANATAVAIGPVQAPYNFGVGFQTSESFLIGGRFGFQTVFADGSPMVFVGKLAPRFEFLFSSGKSRGFMAVEPGLVLAQVDTGFQSSTAAAFNGALSFGAHIFAADGFSVDPFGEISYQNVPDAGLSTFGLRGGFLISGWSWSRPRD